MLNVELRILVDGTWQPASAWLPRISELASRYAADEHLSCCSMQGGFFIDIDGVPWSDESTVDEFWMTQGFIRGLDDVLRESADVTCMPGPWEESRLHLSRKGRELVMEDIAYSGDVSMPRVTVDACEFARAMAPEAEKFCALLEALSAEAREKNLTLVIDNTRIAPYLVHRVREWPDLAEWLALLALVERFEEALVIMSLFERRDDELLVNGASSAAIVGTEVPSERGIADLLARRMLEIEGGGDWDYTSFYSSTRAIEATREEIDAFVAKCAAAGVRLTTGANPNLRG